MAGPTNAKLPATEALPPVSVESESAWPGVILLAMGQVTLGVAGFTVTLAVPLTVL